MRSKAHLWPSFCMPGKGPSWLKGGVEGVATLPSRPAATRESHHSGCVHNNRLLHQSYHDMPMLGISFHHGCSSAWALLGGQCFGKEPGFI